MFGFRKLASAERFPALVQNTMKTTSGLVQKLLRDKPVSRLSVVHLDQISRSLSETLDPLTAVARLHIDPKVQEQASAALFDVQCFMEQLNGDSTIFDVVQELDSAKNTLNLSTEESEIVRVSLTQWTGAEATHYSESTIEEDCADAYSHSEPAIGSLADRILTAEADWIDGCHSVSASEMVVPSVARRSASAGVSDDTKDADLVMPVSGQLFAIAMRNWTSEQKRQEMFYKYYADFEKRLMTLQTMRELRHETALKAGYESFAKWKAVNSLFGDSQTGSQSEVESYLISLRDTLATEALKEVEEMREIKGLFCEDPVYDDSNAGELNVQEIGRVIQAWDLPLMKRLMTLRREASEPRLVKLKDALGAHLTLDQVLLTLTRIVDMCFGLRMERVPFALPGSEFENESWLVSSDGSDESGKDLLAELNPIWKCEIHNPRNDALVGILYLDLFERAGKHRESIVYPLQCAYRIDGEKKDSESDDASSDASFLQTSDAALDGGKRVVPSVALCLNLPMERCEDGDLSVVRMQHSEFAKSLLHEFGHALHYLLSDSRYQTLSGCRGLCFEYLEWVSTLFENFGYDADFIRHVALDGSKSVAASIETDTMQSLLTQMQSPPFGATHALQQVCHSLFDLALFGDGSRQQLSIGQHFEEQFAPALDLFRGGTEVSAEGSMRFCAEDSSKQKMIEDEFVNGHLMAASRHLHFVDYPANYYSYVVADHMAATCWKQTFGAKKKLPFDEYRTHMRDCGKSLFETVLSKGSSHPPSTCLNRFATSNLLVK